MKIKEKIEESVNYSLVKMIGFMEGMDELFENIVMIVF